MCRHLKPKRERVHHGAQPEARDGVRTRPDRTVSCAADGAGHGRRHRCHDACCAVCVRRALPLVRDAEIEGLMRLYTRDIFKAAGRHPGAVDVYLINNPGINAFVAGGQRIFIYTGLLQQAKTPNEVIGVLAHEAGHIAGGHLARMNNQMDKASTSPSSACCSARRRWWAAAWRVPVAQGGQAVMMGASRWPSGRSCPMRAPRKHRPTRRRCVTSTRPASRARNAGPVPDARQPVARVLALREPLCAVAPDAARPHPQSRKHRHQEPELREEGSAGAGAAPRTDAGEAVRLLNSAQVVYQKYPPSDRSLPARYARAIAHAASAT